MKFRQKTVQRYKLKVTTVVKGTNQTWVNIHEYVDPQMLKEALGERGFAELSVTGKHVQEDEIDKATFELIKGE